MSSANSPTIYLLPFPAVSLLAVNDSNCTREVGGFKLGTAYVRISVQRYPAGTEAPKANEQSLPTDPLISYIFTLDMFLTNNCTAVARGNSPRYTNPSCLLTGMSSSTS